jgi:cytochrome c biogenesis protein ResB
MKLVAIFGTIKNQYGQAQQDAALKSKNYITQFIRRIWLYVIYHLCGSVIIKQRKC